MCCSDTFLCALHCTASSALYCTVLCCLKYEKILKKMDVFFLWMVFLFTEYVTEIIQFII